MNMVTIWFRPVFVAMAKLSYRSRGSSEFQTIYLLT